MTSLRLTPDRCSSTHAQFALGRGSFASDIKPQGWNATKRAASERMETGGGVGA